MRPLTLFFLLLSATFAAFQPVQAQQAAQKLIVTDQGLSYQFGEYITFQARLNPPSPISQAFILFRSEGEVNTHVLPVTPDADGKTSLRYEMRQGPLRPFSKIRVSYRVKLQSGEELISEEFTRNYEDNRFPWQESSGDGVTVHWYAGDLSFGQAALDVALRGIKSSSELLLVSPVRSIDLYLYASPVDLQKALELGGLQWVGGHASPDLHLALVVIAPGPEQGLEMDRKIPHELAHILTYDLVPGRYDRLPVWLREGIAAHQELAANPDYPLALAQASAQKNLIPLTELCSAFPQDTGRVFLAYAESQSFTNYLFDKYGQTGLMALINAYGDGLDCETGSMRALGLPLSQLDANWRASALGEDTGLTAFNNLFPYLALLLVLLTVALVSGFSSKDSLRD